MIAMRHAKESGMDFVAVLIDYQMPDTNGLVLARSIRANPAYADTVLVLLTSVSFLSQRDIQESGFDAYLTKPIKRAQLIETLARRIGAREVDAPLPAAARREPEAGEVAVPAPSSPQRILLVEDNVVNQELAGVILRRAGHTVDVARDGREAVAAVARGLYDLVLMDAHMPVMDGYEATRAIRASEREGQRVPIIALTARAMEEDRLECLAAGMDDYLTKPVRAQDLLEAVARWSSMAAAVPRRSGP
jgi:CheY-like chemotaxis protein